MAEKPKSTKQIAERIDPAYHRKRHPLRRLRTYLSIGLFGAAALYAGVAEKREVPTPPRDLRRVRKIREWDAKTVVPRFGFENPEHYYDQAAVGPHLAKLQRPALLVSSRADPMIPWSTMHHLDLPDSKLEHVATDKGGHCSFPKKIDFGLGGAPGLIPQCLAWLDRD